MRARADSPETYEAMSFLGKLPTLHVHQKHIKGVSDLADLAISRTF